MSTSPAIPSASVIIFRDRPSAPEVLLVRRNTKIVFHGGSWVFPGGKVDKADNPSAAGGDDLAVARRTAAREVREETGVGLDSATLQPLSHWTTPVQLPKRFATWFFVATVCADSVIEIDGSEIVDYRWLSIDEALAQRARGEIEMPAPTFVSLTKLRSFEGTAAIANYINRCGIEKFVPRIVKVDDGRCALYSEDAGYESLDLAAVGARHRLMMMKSHWEYSTEY